MLIKEVIRFYATDSQRVNGALRTAPASPTSDAEDAVEGLMTAATELSRRVDCEWPRPAVADAMKCVESAVARVRAQVAGPVSPAPTDELARLRQENEKLAKFKSYVHQRLDEAGVPKDPDSPHKAEGCRIGGRLDVVLGKAAKELEAEEAR